MPDGTSTYIDHTPTPSSPSDAPRLPTSTPVPTEPTKPTKPVRPRLPIRDPPPAPRQSSRVRRIALPRSAAGLPAHEEHVQLRSQNARAGLAGPPGSGVYRPRAALHTGEGDHNDVRNEAWRNGDARHNGNESRAFIKLIRSAATMKKRCITAGVKTGEKQSTNRRKNTSHFQKLISYYGVPISTEGKGAQMIQSFRPKKRKI